jgi:uncharacterized membrane protein
MVLDLRAPHETDPSRLLDLWPVFVSYILSVLVLATYWVNHHGLFQTAHHIDTDLLWSNNCLLFFLSLVPFGTAYMGENNFAPLSTAVYATIMLLCSLAYIPVRHAVMAQLRGDKKFLRVADRAVLKNYFSLVLYATAIPLAFLHPAISLANCFGVAALYFLPNAFLARGD